MTPEEQLKFHAQVLSGQGGTVDALIAVVAAMLLAVRDIPVIREAVEKNLEQHYADHLAKSENPDYMHNFELARDYLLEQLKKD